MKLEEVIQAYGNNLNQLSEDLYTAMRIVIEFMDKSMKGLLTGDLSDVCLK